MVSLFTKQYPTSALMACYMSAAAITLNYSLCLTISNWVLIILLRSDNFLLWGVNDVGFDRGLILPYRNDCFYSSVFYIVNNKNINLSDN